MKNNLLSSLLGRALRLSPQIALTLFFCSLLPREALSATEEFDATLSGYILRMVIALVILAVAGYLAVRFIPGRLGASSKGRLKLLGALNLGRDMVYIIQTGPDVVAVFAGRSGAAVIGRWSQDEWEDCGKGDFGDVSPRDNR
jgi:hypothetical protein